MDLYFFLDPDPDPPSFKYMDPDPAPLKIDQNDNILFKKCWSGSHTSPGGADYVSSVLSYVLWIRIIFKFKVFLCIFFLLYLNTNKLNISQTGKITSNGHRFPVPLKKQLLPHFNWHKTRKKGKHFKVSYVHLYLKIFL